MIMGLSKTLDSIYHNQVVTLTTLNNSVSIETNNKRIDLDELLEKGINALVKISNIEK